MNPRSIRIGMKKLLKILAFLGITLVLLVVVVVAAFYHLIERGEFRRFLLSELESRTQLKVNVGSADIRFGRVMGISFRDLALLEPGSGRPVLTSERVLVRVALMPLLERKLDFYEIRFQQPTVQVARDEKGELRLLRLLLPPVESQRQEGPFALDLRQIRIEKGELVFFDRQEGRPQAPVRFREIDLSLRRIRPKVDSRPESEPPVKAGGRGGVGPTLEFSLKAAVEKDGKQARLSSQGRMILPEEGLSFRGAWLDVESQIEALPADLFWDYYGPVLGLQTVRGTIDSRLRWRGNLGQQVSVKGAIEFKQLEVEAPEIFASKVEPGDTRVELEVEWTPKEIRLPHLDWRSKEISVAMRGTVSRLEENDPLLDLHLTTPFLPLVKARRFFPASVLRSPTFGTLLMATDQGEISFVRAGVAGRLSEIRGLPDPGLIWLEAELQDLGGQLHGEGQLPWRGWSGRIILERGSLSYKGIKGAFGSSRVTELNGVQRGLFTGAGVWEAHARGELDLKELREQLRPGLLPSQISKIHAQLQELAGRGKFEVFLRKAASSPYHVEGRLALENTLLRVGDLSLNQISGSINFSPKEIRLEKLSGLLAGSPLRASGSLSQYMTDRSTFDLVFESPGMKAGVVSRMLLSSGSLEEPGTVRGSVRYQGSLHSTEDRRLSGTLELSGVQFPLFNQPLRDLAGKVSFDNAGIDFPSLRGRMAGSVIEFRGQWRYAERPQLVFSLSSPEMDLGPLFSQIDNGSSDWYDRLQAKGRVNIKKGKYGGFEFSDLRTDLALDQRTWHFNSFSAGSQGGTIQGTGTFNDSPTNLRFSVDSKILAVPVKGFFSWFDITTTEITGKVNLNGNLDAGGKNGAERKRNLNGAFRLDIEDGVLRRLRVLVRILNLLDLSRWFTLQMPDLNQEGIRFRRISGDFKVSQGVYSTQNLLVDSDDLRLTGAGNVDGAEGEVDFVVAVRPFPRVTSVVSSIPLIGRGLAAIKNSLLVASFRVTGSLENPIVIPAPLSTLSEFFFGALEIPKSLIGLSGDETK